MNDSHRSSLRACTAPATVSRQSTAPSGCRAAWIFGPLLLALSLIAPTVALADGAAPGVAVAVTKVWSRATPPGTTVGVVYFEITNAGGEDELVGMETPLARTVEMHSTQTVAGVMRMRRVDSVPVPAGGRVTFGPGGLHAMLLDLTGPLRERDQFPLTLVFRNAGRMQVQVIVGNLGALVAPEAVGNSHAPPR